MVAIIAATAYAADDEMACLVVAFTPKGGCTYLAVEAAATVKACHQREVVWTLSGEIDPHYDSTASNKVKSCGLGPVEVTITLFLPASHKVIDDDHHSTTDHGGTKSETGLSLLSSIVGYSDEEVLHAHIHGAYVLLPCFDDLLVF